jgi:D-alanyl-D-alanine carboxypeptidase/D-alanyl-D-alanine-endopeptidase (penicillin-binding protein 4)
LLAIDTKTGTPLYQRNAGDAFRPASTLKLVVGSAALDKLGSDFHFTTSAALTNVSGQTSTLPRLVVTPGADPFLVPGDLDALVAAAGKAGIGTQALLEIDSPFRSIPTAGRGTTSPTATPRA